MTSNILTNIIIILVSIATGMFIGIIIMSKTNYHGPNAKQECQKIYRNKKTNQCIKFDIKPIECPNPKNNLRKFYELLFENNSCQ